MFGSNYFGQPYFGQGFPQAGAVVAVPRVGVTEDGRIVNLICAEDGEFVVSGLLTETGDFIVGLIEKHSDTGSLTFVLRPAADDAKGFDATPEIVMIKFFLAALGVGGGVENPGLTVKFLPAAAGSVQYTSPAALTIRFRPDVTNGLLFNEVISAVWNESAAVFLDPELLAPVWTAENVLTEGVFGFPGIRNRIQTVRSRITVQ